MDAKNCHEFADIEDLCVFDLISAAYLAFDFPCDCEKCKAMCKKTPGLYEPKQVLQLLSTNSKFFDECVEDSVEFEGRIIHFLRPPQVKDKNTQITRCVHLGCDGCTLPRNSRPFGCRVIYGCNTQKKCWKSKSIVCDVTLAYDAWDCAVGKKVMDIFHEYEKIKKKIGAQDAPCKSLAVVNQEAKTDPKPDDVNIIDMIHLWMALCEFGNYNNMDLTQEEGRSMYTRCLHATLAIVAVPDLWPKKLELSEKQARKKIKVLAQRFENAERDTRAWICANPTLFKTQLEAVIYFCILHFSIEKKKQKKTFFLFLFR